MNTKMKNKAAVLLPCYEKFEIRDFPMPVVGDNDVLIEVDYVGICGSNIHMFQHGPTQPPSDPSIPMVQGHECSGVVVETGANAHKFKPGDRVVIEPSLPCGKCRFCLRGQYNICPDVGFIDVGPTYCGALRYYISFPENFTYRLPDNVSNLEGALVEPLAVGMHAADVSGVSAGKKVVILGSGCIGLMTLQACRVMGASEIIMVDMISKRLEKALELGAMYAVNSKDTDVIKYVQDKFPGGADVVFETAGAVPTAAMMTSLVGRGGTIVVVGTVTKDVPVNFLKINREVTIRTVFRYCNNFPMAIDAISSGAVDVKNMVTDIFDFCDTQHALEESLRNRENIIKAVIKVKK